MMRKAVMFFGGSSSFSGKSLGLLSGVILALCLPAMAAGQGGQVGFEATTITRSEGGGTFNLPVSMTGGNVPLEFTVDAEIVFGAGFVERGGGKLYWTDGGATSADLDFTNVSQTQTLTFPASMMTTQNVEVPIATDSAVENDESFVVTLVNPSSEGVLSDEKMVIRVFIVDGNPTVRIVSESTVNDISEGQRVRTVNLAPGSSPVEHGDLVPVVVNLELSEAVNATVTVALAITSDDMITMSDFNGLASLTPSVEFAANVRTASLTLAIEDDSRVEAAETFRVQITGVTSTASVSIPQIDLGGGTTGNSAVSVTIQDNDGGATAGVEIDLETQFMLDAVTVTREDDGGFSVMVREYDTANSMLLDTMVKQVVTIADNRFWVWVDNDTDTDGDTVVDDPALKQVRIAGGVFCTDDVNGDSDSNTWHDTYRYDGAAAGGDGELIAVTVTPNPCEGLAATDTLQTSQNLITSAAQNLGGGDDLTPPQAIVEAPESVRSADGSFPVEVTFNEPVMGFDEASDLVVTGATVGDIVAAADMENQFQVTLTPDANSRELTVQVAAGAAADDAGNLSEASNAATVRVINTSVLVAAREEGSNAVLRRHAQRLGGLTASVAQNRLRGAAALQEHWAFNMNSNDSRGTGKLSLSCRGGGKTCAWADGSIGRTSGSADGRHSDVYAGVDYLGSGFVVGVLTGFSDSSLSIGDAQYDANYKEVGVYGGVRLGKGLMADVAASWGRATPEISQGVGEGETVSGQFDADRMLLRAALSGTGTWSAAQGRLEISPRLGVLYVEENLGDFVDSVGDLASAEKNKLMQVEAGPQMVYSHPSGGKVTLEVPLKWDAMGGAGDSFSGGVRASLQMPLTAGLSFTLHGDYDGLGSADYQSYGLGGSLDYQLGTSSSLRFSLSDGSRDADARLELRLQF